MAHPKELWGQIPTYTRVEDAIKVICQVHELRQLTGGSGSGWSRWRTLEQCPYAYYRSYILKNGKARGDDEPAPLAIGSLVHFFLALLYDHNALYWLTPNVARALLSEANVNAEYLHDAWRVYQAYAGHYGYEWENPLAGTGALTSADYILPIAVEYPAKDPKTGMTCRYDLVAEVKENDHGFFPGIYVVEHKTAGKFDQDTLDGWSLDGEILGEIAIWEKARLDKVFGELKGVIVNLLGKQKNPQFHRTVVARQSIYSKRHLKVLQHLKDREAFHKYAKYWPQYTNHCITRYGRCDHYNHCAGREGI